MARLSAAASLVAILLPSSARFCPLAPCYYTPLPGWHPTATRRLAPYRSSSLASIPSAQWLRSPTSPLRSSDLSSVTSSRGKALPLWLLSTTLDRCNDLHDCVSAYSGPTVPVFPPSVVIYPPRSRPCFGSSRRRFLLSSLLKGLSLSTCTFLCFVSLRVWGILS